MNKHYGDIDSQIRSHYAQLTHERAMQPDLQERWRKACLNKNITENVDSLKTNITEIVDSLKTFWDAQPEIQDIRNQMEKELAENQNDYYEELEFWTGKYY